MEQPLADRVVLLTGLSRRIGIAYGLAERLLADGATVFASGWEAHDAEMPWGADPDGDGVFEFSAAWTPQDVVLAAGTDYWFSVANASGPGWTWANPGVGPTVGSESFGAMVSVGGTPSVISGPHDGPWNPVSVTAKQDFAFRIWVEHIPEPGTTLLLGLGLLGLALAKRSLKNR